MLRRNLTFGTMFSGGIDSPSLAMKMMPFTSEQAFAIENDKFMCQLLRLNAKPHLLLQQDVEDVGLCYLPYVDVFFCSPPCQPYSKIGEGREADDRRGLWKFGAAYIRRHIPSLFIFETVPEFQKSSEFEEMLDSFSEVYILDFKVLDSHDYGSIQKRKRLFIVGKLASPVSWPTTRRRVRSVCSILEEDVPESYYYTEKGLEYLEKRKPWGTRIHDLSCRSMPAFCKSYGHQAHWKHSIRMPDGRIRKMTPLEVLRLFGIPGTFDCGNLSDTRLYYAAGNAIDIHVLVALLEELLKPEDLYLSTDEEDFEEMN